MKTSETTHKTQQHCYNHEITIETFWVARNKDEELAIRIEWFMVAQILYFLLNEIFSLSFSVPDTYGTLTLSIVDNLTITNREKKIFEHY